MPEIPPDDARYGRQVLFPPIGKRGQEKLRRSSVLIAGCGALGTHAAEQLARAGVGRLRLVDRDLVEWSNLQRQIGFTEEDARRREPKALALARHLRAVGSSLELDPRPVELDHRNALALARDADIIVDGTDNLPTRFLLNDLSYRLRIPWIYAGVVEARGMAQVYSGRRGPCLRCALPDLPPPGTLATCDTAGVLGPAVAAVSGWQCALALRVLVEGAEPVSRKQVRLDLWSLDARVADVKADARCPVCAGKRFEYLDGARAEQATALCGRRAVQVRPARPAGSALFSTGANERRDHLIRRLEAIGPVDDRRLFLRASSEEFTLTLFADGRAIFDGLTDESRARSLYARFVGA